MRSKRFCLTILAVAALAVPPVNSFASTTVNASTTPIVSWNASTTGSITLYPNYSASTGQTNGSVGSVVAASGAGYNGAGCTTAPAQSSNFIDYSIVAPSTTLVTTCDYKNALSIGVTVNSSGTPSWTVSEQLTLAPGTGFTLCSLLNGGTTGTAAFTALPTGSGITGSSTAINESSCSTATNNQYTLGVGSTTPSAINLTPTAKTTTGTAYTGQDILLLIAAGTYTTGSYSTTLNVTLTLN